MEDYLLLCARPTVNRQCSSRWARMSLGKTLFTVLVLSIEFVNSLESIFFAQSLIKHTVSWWFAFSLLWLIFLHISACACCSDLGQRLACTWWILTWETLVQSPPRPWWRTWRFLPKKCCHYPLPDDACNSDHIFCLPTVWVVEPGHEPLYPWVLLAWQHRLGLIDCVCWEDGVVLGVFLDPLVAVVQ